MRREGLGQGGLEQNRRCVGREILGQEGLEEEGRCAGRVDVRQGGLEEERCMGREGLGHGEL